MAARKRALPQGSLDRLLDEAAPVRPARAKTKTRMGKVNKTTRRHVETPFAKNHDAIVRYANSRGVMLGHGYPPVQTARLFAAMAQDLWEVSRRDRVNPLTVLSRALAGYLVDNAS